MAEFSSNTGDCKLFSNYNEDLVKDHNSKMIFYRTCNFSCKCILLLLFTVAFIIFFTSSITQSVNGMGPRCMVDRT